MPIVPLEGSEDRKGVAFRVLGLDPNPIPNPQGDRFDGLKRKEHVPLGVNFSVFCLKLLLNNPLSS